MAELELVWIKNCEVCGREHCRREHAAVDSLDAAEVETGAFYSKCEDWYQCHVAAIHSEQMGPNPGTRAPSFAK